MSGVSWLLALVLCSLIFVVRDSFVAQQHNMTVLGLTLISNISLLCVSAAASAPKDLHVFCQSLASHQTHTCRLTCNKLLFQSVAIACRLIRCRILVHISLSPLKTSDKHGQDR